MRQPVFGAYVAGNLQLLHSPKASDSRCGCARRQYNFAAGKRCRLLVRGCVRDRSQAPTRSNHECSLVVNHGAWFYGCPSKATHPHQQNQRFRRCIVLPAFVQRLTTTDNSGNQHTGESKDCTGTLCIYRGDGARSASLPMRQAIEASRRQANHGSAQHQANTSHPQTRSGVVYNMHIGTPDALARGALSRSIAPRPHPSHASDDSAAHGRHAN